MTGRQRGKGNPAAVSLKLQKENDCTKGKLYSDRRGNKIEQHYTKVKEDKSIITELLYTGITYDKSVIEKALPG